MVAFANSVAPDSAQSSIGEKDGSVQRNPESVSGCEALQVRSSLYCFKHFCRSKVWSDNHAVRQNQRRSWVSVSRRAQVSVSRLTFGPSRPPFLMSQGISLQI